MQDDGEISEENDKALTVIAEKVPQKVDGIKFFLDKLEQDQEFWKSQAAERLRAAEQCKHASIRLKEYLLKMMEYNSLEELNGDAFRVKVQPTQGQIIYDDNLIGPEYMIETKTIAIDKKKIRQDIDSGKNVIGAQLKPGVSLRFYKAKK